MGVILGWIVGELGLLVAIALVSDRADRRERRKALRALEHRIGVMPDDAR